MNVLVVIQSSRIKAPTSIFTSHDSTCTPSFPRGSRLVTNAHVSLFTHTHGDRFQPPGDISPCHRDDRRPADWNARRQNAPDARSSSARASERTHASSRPARPSSLGDDSRRRRRHRVEFIHRPSEEFDSIDRDDDVLEAIPRDDGRRVRRVRVGARRVAARCGRAALDRGDESSRFYVYDPRVRGTVDDGPGSMRVPADVDELL